MVFSTSILYLSALQELYVKECLVFVNTNVEHWMKNLYHTIVNHASLTMTALLLFLIRGRLSTS